MRTPLKADSISTPSVRKEIPRFDLPYQSYIHRPNPIKKSAKVRTSQRPQNAQTYLTKMPLKWAIPRPCSNQRHTSTCIYIFTKSYIFFFVLLLFSSTFLTRPTSSNHLNHRTNNRDTHDRHPKDHANSGRIRFPAPRAKFHVT